MSAKEAIVPSTYPNPCRARHMEHCLPQKELWLRDDQTHRSTTTNIMRLHDQSHNLGRMNGSTYL